MQHSGADYGRRRSETRCQVLGAASGPRHAALNGKSQISDFKAIPGHRSRTRLALGYFCLRLLAFRYLGDLEATRTRHRTRRGAVLRRVTMFHEPNESPRLSMPASRSILSRTASIRRA